MLETDGCQTYDKGGTRGTGWETYDAYASRLSQADTSDGPGMARQCAEKDRNGVPQPTDGLYWSVSHSSQCVAAVVAPYAVGIDIEQIRDVSTLLKEQIASEAEWDLTPENDPTLFFRYWTAKEAVLKATGHGLSGLAHCAVTQIIDDVQIRLTFHETRWLVLQHKISGSRGTGQPSYIAAVTFGGHDIAWQRISMPA